MDDVEIEHISMTMDTFDLVYHVEKGDSYMKVIHARSEEMLYIPDVASRSKGDFSDMMDAVVERFEIYEIKFTMVINDKLKSVLYGFEEKEEYHSNVGEKATVLVGTWRPKCKFCDERMDEAENVDDALFICSPSSNGCEGVLYESGEYGW